MKYIIFTLNFLIVVPILIVTNFFIPFLYKFKKKYNLYDLRTILNEDKEELKNLINKCIQEFNIDIYNHNNFRKTMDKLMDKENIYIKDINTDEINYQKISYVFNIINNAKIAINKLNKVSKDNRTIAYYEEGKNSNLDNLVDEYTKMLKEQGYKKLLLTASKKEVKLKRLLAKLQRDKNLFFNFYLLLFTLNPINTLKVKKNEKDAFELLKNLFDFYRLGHATIPQIYKSIAIQIYDIYKNEFEENELKEIISVLITSCFNLDKNYSNFNNIGKQRVYIKNVVYTFPIFECNTKESNEQNRQVLMFFSHSNRIFPKFFPKNLKKKIIHYFIADILEYYYKMDSLNFFGFVPKKK